MKNLLWAISDIHAMVGRNLLRYQRLPHLLVFSTIQPVMFVLLFAYVFGGAINILGGKYIDFLIPGILVQTVIFGAMQTGIGLVDDLSKGLIDRFNSLPMSRWAVLAGRTIADSLRNVFVLFLMLFVGGVIGFRVGGTFEEFITALGLIILFGFSFSWISANIGLLVKRDAETAQVAGFIWVFPLVFASSIFVPVETMPKALKLFAENSPITATVNAVRGLMLGRGGGDDITKSLLWCLGILLAFAPLAVFRYRRLYR